MEDVHQSFLRDLVAWLRSRAEEAAKQPAPDSTEAAFEAGRATAYVEVLGHMQSQADVFSLDRAAVDLDGFEAYTLLAAGQDASSDTPDPLEK